MAKPSTSLSAAVCGRCCDVALDVVGFERALIDLHNVAALIDQKGRGKRQVAMAIEQVAVQHIVGTGYVVSRTQKGKR